MLQKIVFYKQRLKAFLPVLSKFASGQILLQLLNVVNGFFLLRWLSIEQQALFSFAFSLQTLLINISDLGFSSSIMALVGNKHGEVGVIGRYVKTAVELKNKFFWFGLIVCLVIGPFFFSQQSVGVLFVFNLFPVIAAAFWQIDCSIFSAPLIIKREMGKFYVPQIISSSLRLACNFIFYITGIISSFLILTINALVLLFNSIFFKKEFKTVAAGDVYPVIDDDQNSTRRSEMVRYLFPLFPGLVFNAFYGQLQIFIISFFGKTQSIAEVAALGRLSQIFVLFSSLNALIVAPYIAKTARPFLLKRYLFFVLLGLIVNLIFCLISFVGPQFYLMILGPKYYHLSTEIPYIIVSASLGALSGLLWCMNSVRKWIFWWGSWTYIIGVILCQVIGAINFDLSSTIGVISLSLLTAVFIFLLHMATAVVGFKKEAM